MRASTQYKQRLSELLSKKILKAAGIDATVRDLSDRCDGLASHQTIAAWRSGNYVKQLDDFSFQALEKILAHRGLKAHEISYYLEHGVWLEKKQSKKLGSLWQKREQINLSIQQFAAI